MEFKLQLPDKIELDNPEEFRAFLRQLISRTYVGRLRHGPRHRKRLYLTRLSKELAAYKRNGNGEHLLNIGVYCFLEFTRPENFRFHFDPDVPSVTRLTATGGYRHEGD